MIEQDEVLRMAREAGISSVWAEASTRQLERFAALAFAAGAAHEREACAKVCDELKWHSAPLNFAENCAAAIRGRGMDLLTQHSQSIGEYDER